MAENTREHVALECLRLASGTFGPILVNADAVVEAAAKYLDFVTGESLPATKANLDAAGDPLNRF